MSRVSQSLIELLNNLPISLWGVSDISESNKFKTKYTSAISLAQGYSYTLDDYSSTNFNDFLLGQVKVKLEDNIDIIKKFLEEENIAYHIVSNIQEDPILSIGEFSQKFAALNAGLGWIGKNGLLITEEYGPRVRLFTILVDLDLPFNTSETLNGCGDCTICVKACPTKCLKGATWNSELDRGDIIDVFNCNDKNETRKGHICALCSIGKSIDNKNRLVK